MARQFVAIAFKAGGRAYTYHNDGEPCALGDLVRVAGRNGSEQRVEVVGLSPASEPPPPFETKPILGLADLASAAGQESKEK